MFGDFFLLNTQKIILESIYNIRLCKNYPKVTRRSEVCSTQYAAGMQYIVGMQYAVATQYTVGVSAKRSTHTVDLANIGGEDHYL